MTQHWRDKGKRTMHYMHCTVIAADLDSTVAFCYCERSCNVEAALPWSIMLESQLCR